MITGESELNRLLTSNDTTRNKIHLMRIATVGRAFPPYRYDQEEISTKLKEVWKDYASVLRRLPALHENVLVKQRYLSLPIEEYIKPRSFGANNDTWIRVAQDLGEAAINEALEAVDLKVEDIDALFTVSVTGIASPSLDARLVNRMGLRPDLKRTPIFGLGCVGGVAGLSRAADYVRAFPDQVAVLLSVELCSLTFQHDDRSMANLISCGLFGDGAAAVIIVGEERAKKMGLKAPRILGTRSVFYPDTEEIMGWRVTDTGFKLILSPEVPAVAREMLAPDADRFLADNSLVRDDISAWVCHPGGPKVLSAMQAGLGLPDEAVQRSWDALAEQGNLSSSSVLIVLRETLAAGPPKAGAHGLCIAMGPAFCSEFVLFQWD